jgi:hypothetical protein
VLSSAITLIGDQDCAWWRGTKAQLALRKRARTAIRGLREAKPATHQVK